MRLGQMKPGSQFRFLCVRKMAERMAKPVTAAGGMIIEQDIRSYGVVLTVRKQ